MNVKLLHGVGLFVSLYVTCACVCVCVILLDNRN